MEVFHSHLVASYLILGKKVIILKINFFINKEILILSLPKAKGLTRV